MNSKKIVSILTSAATVAAMLGAALVPLAAGAQAVCPKISQASLKLDTLNCPTVLNQTISEARTHWEIDKIAASESPITDPDNTDINFEIHVNEGHTDHVLVATGQIVITNGGQQTPTLSSVVVNLQTKSGGQKFYNVASAIAVQYAACRDGSGVEGGKTCLGDYLNSSGAKLTLTDVNNNDVTALLGGVPIPPSLDCSGAVVLNYKAEFDLDQAGMGPGSQARIEVLTTFAGAGPRGASPDSVSCTADVNCSGSIDGDNAGTCQVNESETNNVRTVRQRTSFPIPPYTPVCPTVHKVDNGAAALDPACVSVSTNSLDETINGQGEGSNTIEQIAGQASCANQHNCSTDITNTATLECYDGRNELIDGSPAEASITAVCTHEEPSPSPTPTPIVSGDFCTATQGCWGQPNNGFCAGTRDNQYTALVNAFATNFGLTAPGGVLIGDIAGGINGAAGGYAARWTSGAGVRDYLPGTGTSGTLTADLNPNPMTTSSRVLDGQLLAATLNKARDDAGLFQKNSSERLADLVLQSCQNFNIAPALQGLSVKQLICVANKATGGTAGCSGTSIPSCVATVSSSDCGLSGPVSATLSELNEALDAVNNNFDNCTANLGCLAFQPPPPEEQLGVGGPASGSGSGNTIATVFLALAAGFGIGIYLKQKGKAA